MSSLSNERLKEIVEYHPGCENYATRIEWMAMARELLAYREAQGKAVMWWTGPEPTWTGEIESTHAHETGSHQIPLYAAPQLPAIPDEITPDDEQIMAIEGVTPPLDTGNSPVIPDGCEWKIDEQDYFWSTSCGHTWVFSYVNIEENGVNYCQHCGKHVLAAAPKPE